MWSFFVVEFNPVINDTFGFEAVVQLVQIDRLLFQGSPETFNEDVVEIPTSTICYQQVIEGNHREAWRF